MRAVTTRKLVKATLESVSATTTVNLVCDNGWTAPGEIINAVGNQPALGDWSPSHAVRVHRSVYYEHIYDSPPGHSGPGPNTSTGGRAFLEPAKTTPQSLSFH